jgi:nicotinate phosphoribosyltransferase
MTQHDLHDRLFWLASESEIKRSKATDVYFLNTKQVLDRYHIDSEVIVEVFVRELPYPTIWGVFTGVYEVAKLLEGVPVDVWAMNEGSIFLADGSTALYEPMMIITGRYSDFVEFENPILGLLSSSTSISTKAAKFRVAAGDKLLVSFGTRRVHPALAPLVERGCYIAGFDGVSNVLGAEMIGTKPMGTMPHALMQVIGDQEKAWKMFDSTISKTVPRIALIDTFWDEKAEAIKALEVFGQNLWGVRLDTPGSRRGDFRKIIEEVRWELKIRGGEKVKIMISGRLSEENIMNLKDAVDIFGVGTAVSYPPVIDFSAKIVEVHEKGKRSFRAKRGGLGGRKACYRSNNFQDTVTLDGQTPPKGSIPLLKPLIRNGKIVSKFEAIDSIRSRVVKELNSITVSQPRLKWT